MIPITLSGGPRARAPALALAAAVAGAPMAARGSDPAAEADSIMALVHGDRVPALRRAAAVDRALEDFREALALGRDPEATGLAYARAVYVRGRFTGLGRGARIALFRRAGGTADSLRRLYPRSGALAVGAAVCWGLWAQDSGPWSAARAGMADTLKRLCERAIALGPDPVRADAYRLLGRLHGQAPHIPWLLSWPSRARGIACLRRSLELEPRDPVTSLFLAEALERAGGRAEAEAVLDRALARPPRPEWALEDGDSLERCRKLLTRLRARE